MIRQSGRRFDGSNAGPDRQRPGPYVLLSYAAAALAEVGTDEIVFRIWEAIW